MRASIAIGYVLILAGCGSGAGRVTPPGSGGTAGRAPSPSGGGTAGQSSSPGDGGTAGRAPVPGNGGTAGQSPPLGSGGIAGGAPVAGNGGTAGQSPSTGGGGGGTAGQSVPLGNCFVGNPSTAPQIELVYRTVAGQLGSLGNLAAVPLIQPVQGGETLFIGVRARNIDGCPLNMSTALFTVDSGVVVALERRPVTLEATADGWLQPKQPDALSNFSNLPACPKAGLGLRIDGQQYRLQVSVDDSFGRHGEATQLIVPTCGQPALAATCQCLCAANYVLGSACP